MIDLMEKDDDSQWVGQLVHCLPGNIIILATTMLCAEGLNLSFDGSPHHFLHVCLCHQKDKTKDLVTRATDLLENVAPTYFFPHKPDGEKEPQQKTVQVYPRVNNPKEGDTSHILVSATLDYISKTLMS